MKPSVLICAALLSVFLSGNGRAQINKYLTKESQDSVTIAYKWKRYGLFKKNRPLCLALRISNYNPDRILVSFHVDYYWEAMRKASSENVEYCIRPSGKIQGKMWDLVFSSGEFSESQVGDERFMWEIGDLIIKHDSDCRTRLNIQIKPEARAMGTGKKE